MAKKDSTIASDWYHLSFDSLYPIIYAHRTVEAAKGEARFSIQEAEISENDLVLDLCCGNGRHMAHLLKQTPYVVGLDYSDYLLSAARRTLGNGAMLVRGDMCCLPFVETFDVVANYFTSFGYFPTEEQNLGVIRGMARALKTDGRFFIDYLNRNWAETHLEPRSVRYQGDYEIREGRWIDKEEHRVNKTTRVYRNSELISEVGESVQLYTVDEFVDLLTRGGLRVEHMYGDYQGGDCCDPGKPRMIVVGRKA